MIASFLVMAIASFANGDTRGNSSSRNWSVDESFSAISAKGNIEVVLVAGDSKTVNIEGSEKYVNAVHLQVENGVLTITAAKGSSKDRTTVFVPVSNLNKVTLKGGANLSSQGRIESKKLFIRIEGVSMVNVKNLGEIIVDSDDLHQFNYEKSERAIVRIEKVQG